jgi:NTP pyrophosphatase (non-canonical NTP hydrolase)
MTFQDRVEQWASDRNLIEGSTPGKQLKKLIEEVGELASAIACDDYDEMVDAIGDTSVVLAIIARQIGTGLGECQESAWQAIKDRKGRMENGVFVKEVASANPV